MFSIPTHIPLSYTFLSDPAPGEIVTDHEPQALHPNPTKYTTDNYNFPTIPQFPLKNMQRTKNSSKLLDLPVDILREIIDHIPHANDLTSLAMCHSVLHALTIPSIYSRFDIVWPEQGANSDLRAGVDALTYGLATLVKAHELFGEASRKISTPQSSRYPDPFPIPKRRLGNSYAHYTRKFSLGNGPADCVQEYLITKEAGKMLGTLVAIALAQMRNLETFVWDMPTGVLRDVFLSLSSLNDLGDECKLNSIWIRWHNNYQVIPNDTNNQASRINIPPPPPPPQSNPNSSLPLPPPPPLVSALSASSSSSRQATSYNLPNDLRLSLEYPSFSVLPAVKSLTVLDIDELSYLDEMAILIARSQYKLKELRVGIADHAKCTDWATCWESEQYHQVDHDTTWTINSKISTRRLQGVLGTLVGRIYNLKNNIDCIVDSTVHELSEKLVESKIDDNSSLKQKTKIVSRSHTINNKSSPKDTHGPYLSGTLKLEVLELENMELSVPILRKAVDWTFLTSICILNCKNHASLWETLTTTYTNPFRAPGSSKNHRNSWKPLLNIRKIQTNRVSKQLIRFIKDCLSPNTLQEVIFQDNHSSSWNSPVSITAIFKEIVQKHHRSLERLMIDSNCGICVAMGESDAQRWEKWTFNRSQIAYLTSGSMKNLRELGISVHYPDWHIFLQRLPRLIRLRSLYLLNIIRHPHGYRLDIQEVALHIVDLISLRPEAELCYLAIGNKCFEILERRPATSESVVRRRSNSTPESEMNHRAGITHEIDENDEDLDEDELDEQHERAREQEVEEGDEDDGGNDTDGYDNDEFSRDDGYSIASSEHGSSGNDDDDDDDYNDDNWPIGANTHVQLRLQEILFYDRITIFKARHGKL